MTDGWITRWTITPSTLKRPRGVCHALAACAGRLCPALWQLDRQSDHRMHQVVERYARYFRREFAYDFVQYCATDPYRPCETQAWLWATLGIDAWQVLGAACLRYRTYTNVPESFWALQWVWLHPYARHKRLFTAAWPLWLQTYGAVELEPPVSPTVTHIVRQTPTRTLATTEGDHVTLYVHQQEDH